MYAFYQGYKVKVIEAFDRFNSLVSVVEDYSKDKNGLRVGCEYFILTNLLRPWCEDKFKIGDKVATNGTFTGTVIGFDYMTNEVICLSDKLDKYRDKRIRYAYEPEKLSKIISESTEPHKSDTLDQSVFVTLPIEMRKAIARNGKLKLTFDGEGVVLVSNV